MSYIQSVYNRLPDDIIERCVEGWEVDFDRERMFLEVHFPLNGWKVVCWEIVFGECSFYIAPCSTDSNYLVADIIAIGELVNAMNDIAHKDFMEALSEKDGCDE